MLSMVGVWLCFLVHGRRGANLFFAYKWFFLSLWLLNFFDLLILRTTLSQAQGLFLLAWPKRMLWILAYRKILRLFTTFPGNIIAGTFWNLRPSAQSAGKRNLPLLSLQGASNAGAGLVPFGLTQKVKACSACRLCSFEELRPGELLCIGLTKHHLPFPCRRAERPNYINPFSFNISLILSWDKSVILDRSSMSSPFL